MFSEFLEDLRIALHIFIEWFRRGPPGACIRL